MEQSHPLVQSTLVIFFRLHDWLAELLVRQLVLVKRGLLIVAHLALLGFFFPDMRADFGEWAANLLIGILFLSPLSRIFRMRILLLLMGLRRELGIMMAYLATVHGVGYLLDPDWHQVFFLPYFPDDILGIEPVFLFGLGAYFLTLPLLLTSNTLANRLLGGRNWKRLHTIVYIVFVFAVFHRLLVRGADPVAQFQALILLSSYVVLKLLAWKNFLPPLARLIDTVSVSYEDFRNKEKNPRFPTTPHSSP